MTNSRRIGGGMLKAIFVLLGLVVMIVLSLRMYSERTAPAPDAPPLWMKHRLKYEHGNIPGLPGFDNVPINLWFGRHGGRYDTTHLRVASDYLGSVPQWHGESATLYVVWPSFRSIDEENEIRKKNGHAPVKEAETFVLSLNETSDGYWGTDKNGTGSRGRCDQLILDTDRRVKHCNTPPFDKPGERWTFFWPLDETLVTPYYRNPPRVECRKVTKPDRYYDRCIGSFSYNDDLYVRLEAHEELASKILANFSDLSNFLRSLELKP